MKKKLLSVIIMLSLATILVGGTVAGFSDTEASLNNVFEVADLDLKVDKVDESWVGDDFRDDLPWGTGLEPVFYYECARICDTYGANLLLQNFGSVDGTAYLHIRLTNDTALIDGTTYVIIWYDADGDTVLEQIAVKTLLSLHSNPEELGPLPGHETRRLRLEIHPNVGPGQEPRPFELEFDAEFQLVQVGHSFSDTETSQGYLASCGEGCTPGYWKQEQHFDSWVPTGYSPDDILQGVFVQVGNYPAYAPIKNKTLLEALEFPGGDTLREKAQILLRAAVAALLNASHPGIDYPRSEADVIDDVNAALASENEDTIINLATALDYDNNRGCPLN